MINHVRAARLASRARALSLCFSSLCLCASVVGPSFAASPSLGGVAPRGGQRGREVVLSLTGARLADAQEVLFYTPGFTVNRPPTVISSSAHTPCALLIARFGMAAKHASGANAALFNAT